MSTTPQNPIPQFAKQPQAVTPKTQNTTEPAKKKHTIWWVLGSCCAVFAILLLVAAVVGAANWGRIKGYVQNTTNGAVNSVTNITYQNETPNNATNTVVNSVANNTTNNTTNTVTNNTTQNNTTGTSGSTEKNVLVSAVIAKGIDTKTGQAKNAATTFASTDTIYYAVLEVKNLDATDMSVDWFQGDTKVQTYSLKNVSGNKFVNFYLDVSGSDATARVGDYQAKVYFGTTLKKTLSFSVTK